MASPKEKRRKVASGESSTCPAAHLKLRVTADAFGGSSRWDSQHQFWLKREKIRKVWDLLIRTNDGQKIICSKKDLMALSDYFRVMFFHEDYRESGSDDLTLHDTSGPDFEVLLSLYYFKRRCDSVLPKNCVRKTYMAVCCHCRRSDLRIFRGTVRVAITRFQLIICIARNE